MSKKETDYKFVKDLHSFGDSDVEIKQRKRVYDGFFKVDEYHLQHSLFEGGVSGEVCRELLVRQEACAALLIDRQAQTLVMVEQFRIGALNTSSPWMLEMVAGLRDGDEPLDEVIRRESMEEAGCTVNALTHVHSYWCSPGGSDERLHLYVAEVDSSNVGGVHGVEDEHEDIKVHVLPISQVREWFDQGLIQNAATIIALQWLWLHLDDVLAAGLPALLSKKSGGA